MSTRGRVVVGTLGLDQHEVGAMAVAQLLTRNGFEVIYLGRFNTPARVAEVAAQEDAEVVGISVHSWELEAYAGELVERCHAVGAAVAVGGSVLTAADERTLLARGVDATFGPYAGDEQIVARIDELVAAARAGRLGDGAIGGGLGVGAPGSGAEAAGADALNGSLTGRVIAVTGAARGLGRAYAELCAREGAALVLNDLTPDPTGAELAPDRGRTHDGDPAQVWVAGDVGDPATAEAIVAAALERFGRLDGVVSNAGVLRSGPIARIEPEDFDVVHRVHVRGTFLLLQAAGRHWRAEAKAGREVDASFVATTSAAGLYGFLGEAAYSAAKAAIAALTLVAAEELGRSGVRVNAVAPVARTAMTAWMGEPPDGEWDLYAAERVAPTVAWLLGPDAAGVTGRVFEAGGGELALADGWRRVADAELPRSDSVGDVGRLAVALLARAPAPRPILRPDPALLKQG